MEPLVWGWLTAIDLFLIGTAGGAAIISGAAHLLGRGKYDALAESGAYLAPILGLASLLTVMLDLGRLTVAPMNVLYAFSHFPESMISVGTYLRIAFIMVAAANAVFWLFREETLTNLVSRAILGAAGIALGFSVTIYPGIMLALARGHPFWSSPFFPWVLSVSGLLTGLVISAFSMPIIGVLTPRLTPNLTEARKTITTNKIPENVGFYASALIVIELALATAYLTTTAGTMGAANLFTNFTVSVFFWGGFIAIGLLLPLAVFITAKLDLERKDAKFGKTRLGLPVSIWMIILYICFILVAIGAIASRYALLAAGQLL